MGAQGAQKALADETDQLVDTILEQGVDGIIAGFPCTDISPAGKGAGLSGKHSGLFWQLVETYRLVRPKFLLLENVAALFNRKHARDMGRILGALASCGIDAEWDCVAAGTLGAPHFRARAYFLAYAAGAGRQRFFPKEIRRQPEFDAFKDCRSVESLRKRPDVFGRLICGSYSGLAARLHGIGNGNPPAVIRELTRGLK